MTIFAVATFYLSIIEILIPNNFNSEITYIINVLFDDFLGIETNITTSDTKDYQIEFNQKKLIINNDFFSKFNNNLDYLKKENIPSSIAFTKNQFTTEEDIPIIFGNDELTVDSNSFILMFLICKSYINSLLSIMP